MSKKNKLSPPAERVDALGSAAGAIARYQAATVALAKAVAIDQEAREAMDAEQLRVATRDADLLSTGAPTGDSAPDPAFEKAQRTLQSSRATVRVCRERLKAGGAEVVRANEAFLAGRTEAASRAIGEWKAKYLPIITEAATQGRLLEQVYQTDLPELDQLPPAPAPMDGKTGSNPWIQTAKALERIARDVKEAAETEGMYKILQGFTFDSRDWRPGTIINSDWFQPKDLKRLLMRGMIVSVVEQEIQPLKPLTVEQYEAMRRAEKGVTPEEHTPGRPFYYKELKPPADDWSSGLERGAPSAGSGAPWLSPPEGGQ